jgi:hypothetical protein
MADQFDNRQIDKRVVQRYIRKGIVDDKEYERLQKSLPDLDAQAMPIEASFEANEVEEDDTEA